MKILIFTLLLIVVSSCANSKHSAISNSETNEDFQQSNKLDYKLYETLKTDTVVSVARKFGVKAHDIIIANKLRKPYYLEPNTIIRIPILNNDISDEIDELISATNKIPQTVTIGPASQSSTKDKPPHSTNAESKADKESEVTIPSKGDTTQAQPMDNNVTEANETKVD